MKVIWTPRALRDLEAIHRYISEDSVARASEMVARLLRRSEQIADFPRSGRVVDEYRRDDIRELIEPPYRIIYRLKSEEASDVVAVVHSSRKLR